MVWLIILGIILALLTFYLINIIGGNLRPEVSGRHFLRQELRKLGINSVLLSDACINEFVAIAISVAQSMKSHPRYGSFSTAFVENLKGAALNIARVLEKPNSGDTPLDFDYARKILIRHGVVELPQSSSDSGAR